jgi:hypothetical protein
MNLERRIEMGTLGKVCGALWELCGMRREDQGEMDIRGLDYTTEGEVHQSPFNRRGSQDEHSDYLGFANMPQEYADESV